MWIEIKWLTTGSSGGSCERDNDTSDTVKGGEFVDQMSKYQLP